MQNYAKLSKKNKIIIQSRMNEKGIQSMHTLRSVQTSKLNLEYRTNSNTAVLI